MRSPRSIVSTLKAVGILTVFFVASSLNLHKPLNVPVAQAHEDNQPASKSRNSNLYTFTMNDIDGNPLPLNTFKGKVIMVVNTASFCGNTPQYEGLQTLYEQYRDEGFTILAFPANDFGKPGTWRQQRNCRILLHQIFSRISTLQ